jgi:YD repeat-containing protein
LLTDHPLFKAKVLKAKGTVSRSTAAPYLFLLSLLFGSSMFAQSVLQPLEMSVFGGGSFFPAVNQSGYSEKLVDGGTAGGRVAYNFSQYFALEANYGFSVNNVRLNVPGQYFMFNQTFGDQLQSLSVDGVYHFTRRSSRLRPYITAGVGPTWFVPTKQARALFPVLSKSTEFVVNYGAGLKYHFTEHLGLRLDARAGFGRNSDFGLPNSPSLHLNGVEATAGLVFYLGRGKAALPAPPPPAPQQKPTLQPLNPGELSGATGQLCQGRVLTLHATATDPAGHTLSYKWKANGAPVGTNDPDLSFRPNNAGDFEFEVEVSDASDPARTIRLGPKTLAIQDYVLPKIIGVTASPNSVTVGNDSPAHQTVILAADVASSACGGNLSYKWTVSEGTLTNAAGPSAQFDTASLNFDSGLGQTKTITATVTATDETGQSASQNAAFVVDYPAQFKRLGDVIFAKDSARVNNCGKRILIELAAPQAGVAFDILLIGHRAKDELENVRKSSLDTQRLLSVAAVLTGGHGVCGNLDLSQVHLYAAGTEQISPPDPGFCGTSNLPRTVERSGASVKEVDKERRVEVYLVPKGSHVLPPGARNAVVISAAPAKTLGCPK